MDRNSPDHNNPKTGTTGSKNLDDLKGAVEPTLIASKSSIKSPAQDIPKVRKVSPNLARLLRNKMKSE
jgi:hypothetical protein